MVLVGLFVFAIAGMLLGLSFGPLFLFLGFLATTGDELSSLSLWAWLYSLNTNHKNYGLISGTVSLFEDIGWAVGPILAGILYTVVGPAWSITIGGAILFLNLLVALFLTKTFSPQGMLHPFKPHRARHKN